MSKPLEFKIQKINVDNKEVFEIIFYYENGVNSMNIDYLPDGLELNKHYSISDIYGYKVKDDREGL